MADSISPFVLQCLHFTIIGIPDYWAWSERSHSLRKENYIRRQQCITAGHSLANRKKKKKTSTQIQASRRNTRHRQDMAESVIATNCFFLLRVCIGRTTLSNECLKNFKKKKRGSSESTQKFELWRDNSQALKHSKYAHRQCRSLILPILEAAWNQNGGKKIAGSGFSRSLSISEQPRPFACFARKTLPNCFFSPFYKPASSCSPVHVKVLSSSVASQTEAGEEN